MEKLEFPINRCTLDLTEKCNLRCKYCFTYGVGRRSIEYNQAVKTIDWIFKDEVCQSDEVQLDWWGGEPMLKFDLMKRLTEYAVQKAAKEKKRIMVGGTSNATLWDKDVVDWMNQTKAYFMMSIDGIREVQDKYRPTRMKESSFDMIIERLPYIIEKIPFIRSRMAPTPDTIGKMLESVKFYYDLGIKSQMFSPVYEMGWTDAALDEAESVLKSVADYMIEVKLQGKNIEVKHFDDGARNLHMKKSRPEMPCLSGDTKISLLRGTEVEIKNLVGKENFWVYSCNEQGEIVPGLAKKVWKTGTKEVVKVTLDNGETFRCTPDHLLMLRDGTYLEAKDCLDKSMMPLYRDKYYFYERVKSNRCGKYEFTYKLVDKFFNGEFLYNDQVHHIDLNKDNNSPKNLKRMTGKEHYDLHVLLSGAGFVDKWKSTDKDFIKNHSERSSKQMTELNKKMWNDPVDKKRLLEQVKRNGEKVGFKHLTKEQLSEFGKKGGKKAAEKIWNDPNFIKYNSEVHSKLGKDRKIGWGLYWNDPNFKEKMKKVNAENGRNNGAKNFKLYNEWNKTDRIISYREFKQQYNHKIVSIEFVSFEDVYDMEVETYHNFALSSGIFVHNCGAGRFYVGVSVDGIIYPCHRFNKYDGRDWTKKEYIGTIDEGITRPEFRDKFIHFLDIPQPKCKDCKWYGNLCDVSCYAINFDLTGNVATPPDVVCKWMERQGNAIHYYYEQLLKNKLPVPGINMNARTNMNQPGGRKMSGSCICNNMCYLEGTEHETKIVDRNNDFACHCYSTSYNGGLNDQARALTVEEMNVGAPPKEDRVSLAKNLTTAVEKLNSSVDQLVDVIKELKADLKKEK